MVITYDDIKHKLQPPLDCSEIKDLRGRYFHNREIINYENTDFVGCVLYHCFPNGIKNAIEVNPATSIEDTTLQGANLEGADLRKANLQGANLLRANLKRANLKRADLERANLYKANLEGANLQGANLQGAYLQGANLKGANLENAKYNDTTIFPDTITESQKSSMVFIED